MHKGFEIPTLMQHQQAGAAEAVVNIVSVAKVVREEPHLQWRTFLEGGGWMVHQGIWRQ